MTKCAHGSAAPDQLIRNLPECQAGTGRHKCPVCAYREGFDVGRGALTFAGPAETCAQRHGTAPTYMLRGLNESQAGVERHRCCYRAYELGREAGRLSLDAQIELGEQAQIDEIKASSTIEETVKEQLVLARRGQGAFRAGVINLCGCCRLTGIGDVRFLRASHIKPWRDCDNSERLDPHNGLLLTPNADLLFDAGWISFADDGKLVMSKLLPTEVWKNLGLGQNRPGAFAPAYHPYLAYHRTKILKR